MRPDTEPMIRIATLTITGVLGVATVALGIIQRNAGITIPDQRFFALLCATATGCLALSIDNARRGRCTWPWLGPMYPSLNLERTLNPIAFTVAVSIQIVLCATLAASTGALAWLGPG